MCRLLKNLKKLNFQAIFVFVSAVLNTVCDHIWRPQVINGVIRIPDFILLSSQAFNKPVCTGAGKLLNANAYELAWFVIGR